MIQIDNKWKAEEGYFFVRKSDGVVMGDLLFLSETDSINNYMERPFSEQEREEFEQKYSFGGSDDVETSGGISDDGALG